jgi:hypothetical protein
MKLLPTTLLLAVLSACSAAERSPSGDGDGDGDGDGRTEDASSADTGDSGESSVGPGDSGGTGPGGDGDSGADTHDGGAALECEPQGALSLDSDVEPSVDVAIRINQIGYDLRGPKRAVVEASAPISLFQVVRSADDEVVFEGKLSEHAGFSEWGSSAAHYVADFTCMNQSGDFRLYVNGEFSASFEISEALLFTKTIGSLVEYFTASRANDAEVVEAERKVRFFDSDKTADVRGGWYDASGDISKYLSHLSYANYMSPQQTPLVAWALAWVRDRAASRLSKLGLAQKVESEALWGADYLLRVLAPEGYFYINVFDRWSGNLSERRICSYAGSAGTMSADWQAGLREGAGMSIAALARIASFGIDGEFTSRAYLEGAEKAFAHLEANNTLYIDNHQENIIDDYTALLAASELFSATSDARYLDAARARAQALEARLHGDGYFIADGGTRPFWHGSDAGLPILSLVRYAEVESDDGRKSAAIKTIRAHLTYLASVTAKAPNPYGYARQHTNVGPQVHARFFIPHENESGYWWQGENARLGSLASAAIIGGRMAHPEAKGPFGVTPALAAFAEDQLDWVLGKNPLDLSFLMGFGRNESATFCNDKKQSATRTGGIANGITGREADGSGMQWRAGGSQCWEDWRWLEQWLPHSAWFLLAITATSE